MTRISLSFSFYLPTPENRLRDRETLARESHPDGRWKNTATAERKTRTKGKTRSFSFYVTTAGGLTNASRNLLDRLPVYPNSG